MFLTKASQSETKPKSKKPLGDRILEQLNAPTYKPPTLPIAATELLRLAQQRNTNYQDVSALLEKDAMLAGRIMSIVQSPMYAGASKISSIPQALSRLGMNALRDVVLQVSMELTVFRDRSYSGFIERLRKHSVVTAHVAKRLCAYCDEDGEQAFLLGLLHDVGVAAALISLSKASGRRVASPSLVAVWTEIERIHGEATGIVVRHWGMDKEIQHALVAHHKTSKRVTTAVVTIAEAVANQAGFAVVPRSRDRVEGLSFLESRRLAVMGGDTSEAEVLEAAGAQLNLNEAQEQALVEFAIDLPNRVPL